MLRQVICSTIDDLVEVTQYSVTTCIKHCQLPLPVPRRHPFPLHILVDQYLRIDYLLPRGLATVVVPEAVFALVAFAFETTFQIKGDVGFVVGLAIRIALGLAAYHIMSRRLLQLPNGHGDGVLEVGDNIHILCPMSTK